MSCVFFSDEESRELFHFVLVFLLMDIKVRRKLGKKKVPAGRSEDQRR